MNVNLFELDSTLKKFLSAFIIVLSIGVTVGLIYLNYTTNFSTEGAVTRIQGSSESEPNDDFDIPEFYPKPVSELLITTHNHIIGFAFIFFFICGIFYFNSTIKGFWKIFFTIEPFISILITFGSLWGIRYIGREFSIIAAISSTILYVSFYFMAIILLYELIFKKNM